MAGNESSKVRAALSRVAKELEDEETKDTLEELRAQAGKPTLADLLQVIREAPPEERAALREILAEEGLPTGGNGPPAAPPAPPTEPLVVPPTDPPGGPARRKRPGRKAGAAYDWYVDDETGEVTRSNVAVVYSGPDEPDEVEMLDLPPEGETREGDEE